MPFRDSKDGSTQDPDGSDSILDLHSQQRIEAAEGYHMIAMYPDALRELLDLPLVAQRHPSALHLLCRVYWALRDLPRAHESCDAFIQAAPNHPFGYGFKAMLLADAGEHSVAFKFLLGVADRFPAHATMHYDLARAAAACGLWAEARHWVYRAVCSQPDLQPIALESEEFAPIRQEIEAMRPN